MTTRKYISLFLLVCTVGLFFRLWHIEFGLPQTFPADEPEIVEPAIKYTYEIRNILRERDYYKLVPISFIYGTFPTYLNTFATMGFSKILGLLAIGFEKMHIYVFLRVINAFFSMFIVLAVGIITQGLFKNKWATFWAVFFAALNWKFIVHAHYINADLTQTILLSLSYAALLKYYLKESDTKYVLVTGILFGLAIGTKITTLLGLPFYLFIFWAKKDWKSAGAFLLIILGAFIISNPFALIFSDRFFFRIYEMFFKEAGLVFDSVDTSPFKYFLALNEMATPIVWLSALFGTLKSFRNKNAFHIFLAGTTVLYILFFSIQNRRVDRWLLPILPIFFAYAGYGITIMLQILHGKKSKIIVTALVLSIYLLNPIALLTEFQRETPRSAAYYWALENLDPKARKLVYTEEGLDPFYKLPGAHVELVPVYENEGAQFFYPQDPEKYEYVVVSKQILMYKNKMPLIDKYPLYILRWRLFENSLSKYQKVLSNEEILIYKVE